MIEAASLSFVLGFVAFFATGIDDTLAYAGGYVHNRNSHNKKLISAGIFIGTLIALAIAKFAGDLMHSIPERHLIGGGVLVLFGLYLIVGKEYLGQKTKRLISPITKRKRSAFQYVGLGMALFFGTGLDDIIAYSNLMISDASWQFVSLGVLTATGVSVVLANRMGKFLKKAKHPERIGGAIILSIGVLISAGVL